MFCPACNKDDVKILPGAEHLKETHALRRWYECRICSKVFSTIEVYTLKEDEISILDILNRIKGLYGQLSDLMVKIAKKEIVP